MVNLPVPFFSNTPDDTHCFQAALRMVFKHFAPQQEYSWQQLDEITAKQPGKWTWAMAGLIWLHDHGFAVANIEDFDYERFAQTGEEYLVKKYGPTVGHEQVIHSALAAEQARAQDFAAKITTEQRLPDLHDMKTYLEAGYVLMANVNSRALNDRPGYVGHMVVIKGYDHDDLIIHDPGLPPIEDRQLSFEQFCKGWDYPDTSARNLMAIKPLPARPGIR